MNQRFVRRIPIVALRVGMVCARVQPLIFVQFARTPRKEDKRHRLNDLEAGLFDEVASRCLALLVRVILSPAR